MDRDFGGDYSEGLLDDVQLRNGVHLPMIAAGSGAKNSTWANAAFRAALSVGFTAFDTAHEYGNQEGVGLALATVPRSQFFLTTKVRSACNLPSPDPRSASQPSTTGSR